MVRAAKILERMVNQNTFDDIAQGIFSIFVFFPVWLRNRLISAGLEPVTSNTEKSCIASYYRQFSRISN